MKKFLIGVVILIPILVVIIIMATSSIVEAIDDQVYPISMEFKSAETNKKIEFNDVVEVWMEDEPMHILIDIYPTIAFDRTATYKIDKVDGYEGDMELQSVRSRFDDVENEYAFIPKKAGTVRIIVMANGDNSISKGITFLIKSNVMSSMNVVLGDGSPVGDELVITGETRLYCDVLPLESMSDIKWSSDNTDYITISDAGKLQPIAAGRAIITCSAVSKSGGVIEKQIVVDSTSALVKNKEIYSSLPSVDENWIMGNVRIDRNATVSSLGDNKFKVDNGEESTIVTVHCGEQRVFDFSYDMPSVIYTNRRVTFLECEYFDYETYLNDTPDVTYSILNNEGNASIDGIKLTALKVGTITLVATLDDGVTAATKEILIKECPLAFELTLNKEDYELGLARDRKWGIWFYDKGELINTYQFGSSLNEEITEVEWYVSDSALQIDANHLLTFTPACAGKDIEVTASVMAGGLKTGVKRSFLFSFVDDANAVNVYNTEEFMKVQEMHDRAIVLQPSVDADGKAVTINLEFEITMTHSLYGNGVTIDTGNVPSDKIDNNSTLLNYSMKSYKSEKITNVDFTQPTTVYNVAFVGANNMEESSDRGAAIYLRGTICKFDIEYCRIRYFHVGIKTMHVMNDDNPNDVTPIEGDINIDGCFISDCFFCGMLFSSNAPESKAGIHIRDTIMSNFSGACIFTCNASADDHNYYQNIYPNIYLEGRVEMYNWKTTEAMGKMLSALPVSGLDDLASQLGTTSSNLMDAVGKVVKDIFTREDMAYAFYNNPKDGQQYISLGLLALGTYCHAEAEEHTFIEDDALTLLKVKIPYFDGTLIGTIIGGVEQGIKSFVNKNNPDAHMTIMNDLYLLCYDFSKGEPRVGPGDPLPLNEDLYTILDGTYAK